MGAFDALPFTWISWRSFAIRFFGISRFSRSRKPMLDVSLDAGIAGIDLLVLVASVMVVD